MILLNCVAGEDTWKSLGNQGIQTSHSYRKSTLNIHWKDWCWSWSSNTLVTWFEEPTHWKRRWCWERLKAGGEAGDRGWDGWMALLTQWTWVWADSVSGEEQWSLASCSPWDGKYLDTPEWLNNNKRTDIMGAVCFVFTVVKSSQVWKKQS